MVAPRPLIVTIGGDLDLIADDGSTRHQLAVFETVKIPSPRRPALRLFVNLAEVTSIDPCALLYLVAQTDRLSETGRVRVSGSYPRAPLALQMFADAGFHKYMRSKLPQMRGLRGRRSKTVQVEISSGSARRKLNPADWTKLHKFLSDTGSLGEDQTEAVYQAFGECIENVVQHAFGRPTAGKWYALAIRPRDDLPARAVVLDLGVGIAGSVRKPRWERTLNAVARALEPALKFAEQALGKPDDFESKFLARLRADDWFCVYMATLGLRTQAKDKERGTGLIGLRDAMLDVRSGALHVHSGTAAVTWRYGTEPQPNLLPTLRGTIVCIEFDAGTA